VADPVKCVIKVLVQLELGACHFIGQASGNAQMKPGWRFGFNCRSGGGLFMVLSDRRAIGSDVGAVRQALNMAMPALGEWASGSCRRRRDRLGKFLTAQPEPPAAVVTGLGRPVELLMSGGLSD